MRASDFGPSENQVIVSPVVGVSFVSWQIHLSPTVSQFDSTTLRIIVQTSHAISAMMT